VFIHNAHSLMIGASADTTLGEFERAWRVACFGAMTVAKLVLPAMAARGDGAIIFSGATASLRGGANFSAFASAKFALRGLAQSLARECGPRGIHVAHVVIDGLIEEAQTQERFGRSQAMRIDPDRIAQIYLEIVRQHPSAWTHELDLRPHGEGF
jgi:NAD(P)-dependent dehydrogenase (short-subunit alcohol dehydrogenase family)